MRYQNRNLILVILFGAITLVTGCGGGGGGDDEVNQACVTGTTVLSDSQIDDQVELSSTNCYSYTVSPGDTLTVGLVGLTGDADLAVLSPETCLPGHTGIPGTDPEDCTLVTTGNQITLAVTGNEAANYTLSIAGTPSIAQPTSESTSITRDISTIGQVGTRGISFYSTTGLTPGTYTISVFGLSGAAELHIDLVLEEDCTIHNVISNSPQDCIGSFTDSANFRVTSGPLNREGAAYIILVH
jgi:hypothetical protein